MISLFVVGVSLVLALVFVIAYCASPAFRERIERPKHAFLENVGRYNAAGRDAPADGGPDET